MFYHQGIKASEIATYNQQYKEEFENIRDFIILHYKLNNRSDSAFWRMCRDMEIPDSLAYKIALFKESGNIFSWQQVMIGQGSIPQDYYPMAY